MNDAERRQLDEQGFVLLERCMSVDVLRDLRCRLRELFDEEGNRAGSEFRTEAHAHRLANLVDKGDMFRRAILFAPVVECVRQVLGPEIKLSSLNARSADPDTAVGQPLHVDMNALPDDRGYWVCNAIWMLDDFTRSNGPTRVVPGSHTWRQRPHEVLADPMAPHPDEVLLTGPAGSIAVMNAHVWHGGTANRTGAPRLAMHAFYCRRDMPQQQYQRALLRRDVQERLDPQARHMLALDDPLNDQLSAGAIERSGFMKDEPRAQ
jgi:ectoine hydroxylase-related dioxygenase (phytanoyl-CoA dioxygenase family)